MYILNAFSINMLSDDCAVNIKKIDKTTAFDKLNHFQSAVGHADTAKVISNDLGLEIPANRISVSLKVGDEAVVAQYIGPRLQEGTTELPEGAEIKYFHIEICNPITS